MCAICLTASGNDHLCRVLQVQGTSSGIKLSER